MISTKQFIIPAAVIVIFSFSSFCIAASFDDAIGLWHFADASNSADPDHSLKVEGDVRLGVPLSESDAAESRLRGSDGLVADLSNGGWFDAGLGKENCYDITGNSFTWYLRLCAPDGDWNGTILSHRSDSGSPVYQIYANNDFIQAECSTIRNRWPPFVNAPFIEMRGETACVEWHDLVFRVNGVKLQLFVDGRLYDEDFMLEDLLSGSNPLLLAADLDENGTVRKGFHGLIDTAALWNRALSDSEILILSGGPCKADRRQLTDLGNNVSLQYWMPPNNYNVGDCMPFYAEGVFHFMFLLDKHHHSAKNGLGGHQWIQATSKDLVHWTHQPFLFEMETQEEGSFCTGSVFYHNGTYYAYYSNRAYEYPDGDHTKQWKMLGQLAMATSKDGIHFEKTRVEPLIDLPEEYAHTTRDPVVFQNPETNRFHMYFTTSYKELGCWAQAVSDDLYHWELVEPIYAHRDTEPECPDWFQWRNKYYTIANHTNGYWLWSDSPNGPWELPQVDNTLMPGITTVPKTAPFGEDRRIICGWTREKGFGGHAVFHELIRHNDGTLGEKFVPEMIPPTDQPVIAEEKFTLARKEWRLPLTDLQIKIRASFPPEKRDRIRDLLFQFSDDDVLRVSPRAELIRVGYDYILSRVDFNDGRVDLTLVLKENLADIEYNTDRTLTCALKEPTERHLIIQGDGEDSPEWIIDLLEVRPLKKIH